VRVETLGAQDWRSWRDLRLEALKDTPIGFAELYQDASLLSDQQWRERWTRPGIRVMAFQDAEPLGMAGGFLSESGAPVLFGVYVRPAHRGGRVLGALVAAVQAWAPEPLVLEVHEDNHRACRAYQKLGFVLTGERKAGEGIDGRDLLGMRR
jgi:RimJ/RimL family protein N-acetyltransferase